MDEIKPSPFCGRPGDADGGIFHVGSCEGLQQSELNKLQQRIIKDERDAALLKLDSLERQLEMKRDDWLEVCKENDALQSRLDSYLELCREIEFFLRGHPGEASVLRAKVRAVIDGEERPRKHIEQGVCTTHGRWRREVEDAHVPGGCPICAVTTQFGVSVVERQRFK